MNILKDWAKKAKAKAKGEPLNRHPAWPYGHIAIWQNGHCQEMAIIAITA